MNTRILRVSALLAAVATATGVALTAYEPPAGGSAPTPAVLVDAPSAGPRSPVAPPPPPTTPARRTATVVLSGDLLWHDTVWQSAQADAGGHGYDFDPMFAGVRSLVAGADLAVCHEEVPFAARGQQPESYPVFAAPPSIARWIGSMGWDACTTDSNHSIDQGFPGLVRTYRLLERAGVRPVGTFPTRAARSRPVIVTTDSGVRIGLVGGTYYLNGFSLPPSQRWAVSMWQARNLIAQARAAHRAGADIVLVQYHGGDEYSSVPNAAQTALVRRLTASPYVDLVLAEHAHVVQPITRINGTWVVYGMGNLVAQGPTSLPRSYEGIMTRFRFVSGPGGWHVDRAAYVPVWWSHLSPGHPIRIHRVVRALRSAAPGSAYAIRLREALTATRAAVHSLGGTPGLVER